MISVILGILFVIGFILLFLLLILALILLLPFRYKIDASTYPEGEKQKFFAEVRLSWMFQLFEIYCKYEKGLKITARLAFYCFFDMDTSKDEVNLRSENLPDEMTLEAISDQEKEVERDSVLDDDRRSIEEMGIPMNMTDHKISDTEALKEDGEAINSNDVSLQEDIISILVEDDKKEKSNFITSLRDKLKKLKKEDEETSSEEKNVEMDVFHILDKLDDILYRMEEKWDSLEQGFEEWEDKLERFQTRIFRLQAQLEDERNRYAFGILWKYLWKLLRHISPRKAYGHVLMGFDNPASTGQAIGMLCILCKSFFPDIRVEGDFERKTIDSEIHVKGRIYLGSIAWYILMVLIKKEVWRLYKNYKKIRRE